MRPLPQIVGALRTTVVRLVARTRLALRNSSLLRGRAGRWLLQSGIVIVALALGGAGGYALAVHHQGATPGGIDKRLRNVEQPSSAAQPTPTTSHTKAGRHAVSGTTDNDVCWRFYGRTAARTSDGADLHVGVPAHMRWRVRAGSLVEFSPSVCDGVAYFNTAQGRTFAVRMSDGKVLWKRHTGTRFDSTPAIDGDRLILGGVDGYITALDRATGKTLWRLRTGAGVESSPVVVNGIVYCSSIDQRVYAIHDGTGKVKWAFRSNGAIKGSPAVVNGVVYIANYAGQVIALHAGNGAIAWTRSFELGPFRTERFYSSTAVANGTVFVGGVGGSVYALNANNGHTRWKSSVGAYVYATPVVSQGRVFVGAYDHRMHAYSARNGTQLWSKLLDGSVSGTAVVLGSNVYVSTLTGHTYAFDTRTGKLRWQIAKGKYVPAVATKNQLVFALNGAVVAYRPAPLRGK